MADNEKGGEGGTAGSGGRKLLIVGLVAGLVVGAGAAGVSFLLTSKDEASSAPVAADVAAEEAPKPPEKTSFVKLDRLSAPLVSNGKVLGYVLLDLSIEVKGSEDELDVAQHLPELRAAFLKDVTATPIGKPDQPMVIDYDALTGRLRTLANQQLGKEVVMRVLVTQNTRL